MFTVENLAAFGGIAVLLCAVSWTAEQRRLHRRNLDRVGFMPWTAVFFAALLAAVLLLGLAAKQWIAGG